jgi:L-amino acid N-acyltransferase YncA
MSASVRLARPEDAESIAAIYAPIVASTTISFELEPPSVDEMRNRIENTVKALPWLVSVDAADRVNGRSSRDPFWPVLLFMPGLALLGEP